MFSTIFIKRPRFAFVISLVIMLAGVASYFTLPVAEYPQVSPPVIVVGTFYPGASAQVIADTVAAPLETAINGVEGLTYFESKSDNSGNYSLTITFETGVNEDMALTNVNNAVKMAESNLPQEVKTNLFSYKRSSDILGVIALLSNNPEHDLKYISNYASINITDNLSRLKGVGQSFVFSDKTYSMRVWLDPLKLRGFNMSIGEISAAIQAQNVQAAAGSVGTDSSNPYMSFKVDTQGRLKTPEEFQNIIVRTGADGRQILLRDVARVEMGTEKYTGQTMYNGGPAAIIGVFKMNDANALTVMTKVRNEMDRLAKDFPEGMEWTMGYDSTRFVKVSMKEIAMTLIMTFILVVII
ncbi:MAG: efflux RND transporter permease subunit, partial [Victivallales bacterium]|nr:efflux RND transporter permease subunit [Victivallales bacterium]